MNKENKHKPDCSSNIVCAVNHVDGICPGYKPCDCGAELPKGEEWQDRLEKEISTFGRAIKRLGENKKGECLNPEHKNGCPEIVDLDTPLGFVEEKCGQKEYDSIHAWLRKHFGSPKLCEATDCNGESKIFDWALKRGLKHERSRTNYMRLCRKCHVKYDWNKDKTNRLFEISHTKKANKKRGLKLRGVKKPPTVGAKARELYSKEVIKISPDETETRYPSVTEAAKSNGVTLNGVWNIIKGTNKQNRRGERYIYA